MPQAKKKLPHTRRYLLILLLVLFGILPSLFQGGLQTRVRAAGNFVVTNTNDSGAGSLRQAILDANGNPGADLITFSIGSGPQTIAPTSALPVISDPVIIDGPTQPGYAGSPLIELNAAGMPSQPVLRITAGSSTLRGLIINHFKEGGIFLDTAGGNHVEGCYIGPDATGSGSTNSVGNGIAVAGSANNVIGGTTAHSRNVISGINAFGISIFNGGNGNLIQGNYIGLNAAGTAGLANFAGITLATSNNTVGGTTPEARNVIAGGDYAGIVMQNSGTSGNVIQGNYIGTDATGMINIGVTNYGIAIFNSSNNNLIGGTTPGARNVVSGNGWGISIASSSDSPSGNVVQGNYVGVASDGATPLGNRLDGIRLAGALNTTVGGVAPGAGNTVAFNGPAGESSVGRGVLVLSGSGNSIRGNAIFSNGRLGIDLGGVEVTPNDSGDGDSGANNLQNFPVITSVVSDSTQTMISGTLNSTANTSFTLDFYVNSVCDPSGFGEGARRVGSTNVTTNGSGDANFSVGFAPAVAAFQVVTATATDPAGNTSEFSQCSPTQPAIGVVDLTSTGLTVNESSGVAAFNLTRSGGSAGSLIVGYVVTGETATVGTDFTATQGTITFADGESAKTITVPIINDNVNEPAETARVTLSAVGNLDTLGSQNAAILTINDDDQFPRISIGDVSAVEGNSGTTNFNFPITLSNPSSGPVTISFDTMDGTATVGGNDYLIPTANSVTIPAGQTSGMITIQVIGDATAEGDDTFLVRMITITTNNAVFIDSQATGTILNDDGAPTMMAIFGHVIEFNGAPLPNVTMTFTYNRMGIIETRTTQTDAGGNYNSGQVACANTTTVTPSLTGHKFSPKSISYVNTCADQIANFGALPPVVISQVYTSGGEAGATYRNDYIELFNRGEQNVNLSGWSVQYAAATGTSWQATSLTGVVLVPGQRYLIQEASAGANGTTLPLPDRTGGIDLSASGGKVLLIGNGAPAPTGPCPFNTIPIDLVGYGASANCFEGAAAAPAPAATSADRRSGDGCVDTDDNGADFALGTPNPRNRGAASSPCGATVQFSATNYNVIEGVPAVTITVTRGSVTSGVSTVDFLTSDFSASQARDYEVASGTLSFAAGETSKTFSVLVVDDGYVETNEMFNLALSNPVGAVITSPISATVTIMDNDTAGSISPAPKRFAASLDGAHETPTNNSTAKGTGLVLLDGPESSAKVGLQFQNLGSAEMAAHIHGPAVPFAAAPILFLLPTTNPVLNFAISPTAQQVADLKANLHYLNVHSTNFPDGEIRGQLLWNPTLEENFFVRQQYLDFLSRDGDPGGFNFWVGTITPCQADTQCFHDRTIAAADAFFFEPEFQQTAGFVFRAYRAAFGNNQPFPNPDLSNPTEADKLIDYPTFVADRARVVGGANLAAAQQAFANLFVSRPAFTTKYALATNGPQFVDAILMTIQSADAVDLTGQRQALIDQYNNAGGGSDAGRAMVLYRLADDNPQNPINNQAFINAEYNRQFALTLYFGYLRRNPDIGGFLFWQSQINLAPVRDVPKQNALVCSFITAAEYQRRFAASEPRTNAECPQ